MNKKNELGAEALRENWARLGTRSLILKTIRNRAAALDVESESSRKKAKK
jgi:hypothetical protein